METRSSARAAWRVTAVTAWLVLLGGVASLPAGADEGGASRSLRLLHWWNASSELAAVDALAGALQRRYPDLTLATADALSHGGGARLFQTVAAAAAARSAPDGVQVNAGAALRPYVEAGLLTPLDSVWRDEGLEQSTPIRIREMSRVGDHYYAVPVGVHRNNLLWYDARVLRGAGIDPAALRTWEDVFAAAEGLRGAGLRHPIQVGESWTASLALEGIVAGLGADVYQDWVTGRLTAPDDPRLVQAFEILTRVLSYASPDQASTPWNEAVERVVRGESAFCLMGDWAEAQFRMAGLVYGEQYGALVLPGTRGMYGVSVDSLVQPRGTRSAEDSTRLMRAAASNDGQAAFNAAKGSVPARTDVCDDAFDAYQRSAIADLRAASVVYPNIAGATHDAFKNGLDALVADFQARRNVAAAVAALAALTHRTQHKFQRTWSLR